MEEEKKSFKGSWTYLKRTYQFAKKERKYLFYFIIGCIFYSVVSILAPILTAKQIVLLTGELWKQLFYVSLAILGIELFRNLDRYLNNYFIDKYFFAVKKNIQMKVAEETLKINMKSLNEHSSGIFIERIGNDTDTLADIFTVFIDYISVIVTNIGILFSIFFLNKIIFCVYLIFLLVLFFCQKHSMKVVQEKRKIVKKHREIVSGFISEMVRGAKDIKILNSENSFLDKTSHIIDDLVKVNYKMDRTRAKFQCINGSIRDLLDFVIIISGVYFIIAGNLDIATMLIIFSYRGNILNLSHQLESLFESLMRFNLSAKQIGRAHV